MTTDHRDVVRCMIEHMRDRMTYGLEQTPDERLDWSPHEAAHTPLQVADRCVMYMSYFAAAVVGEQWGPDSLPPPSATRDEAIARITEACDHAARRVAGLSEADLARQVPAPWGQSYPVAFMLEGMMMALGYVQGQLNYLQLSFGDTDPHQPPSWSEGTVRTVV